MAQRRMFSKQIVSTDAFLDMPTTSQLLYFHLNMEADDDGFVASPRKIMKILGSSKNDLDILVSKRFVLPFESGVCVIKHWLIHNYIRKDTYQETKYLPEKESLDIKENGAYTERLRLVDDTSTQDRIGKVRLGQVSIDKNIYGEFENVKLSKDEYEKLVTAFSEKNTLILIEELSGYIASKRKNYASHYATLLNWGRRKIQDYKQKTNKRTII